MRTILVGAVASSRTALHTLIAENAAPRLVVTLPPERSARHSDYSDLRPLADEAGISVLEAPDVNAPEVLAAMAAHQPDYVLVIGWSQICRRPFLDLPRHGAIGFHPSRLPENRGRAVIPWTILQGLNEAGSSLFWLDEGMDSGDLLAQETFSVSPWETATTLYAKHMDALASMLREALPALRAFDPPRRPQDHERATYCARRGPDDGLVDWDDPARSVDALIRATTDPYPGAWTWHGEERLRLWEADYVGPGPYWGLPGQVQALTEDGALVQCGDREHVLLRSVQLGDGERRGAHELLRVHARLNPRR
jgi:methionyl-tRNA formyltransferase